MREIDARPRVTLRLVRCVPDGNCLFEALGKCMGKSAQEVRHALVGAFFQRLTVDEQETVAASEGITRDEYARRLSRSMWGGHNEMVLASKHYGIAVCVFRNGPKGLQRVVTVRPRTSSPAATAHIVWDGTGHYDALQ